MAPVSEPGTEGEGAVYPFCPRCGEANARDMRFCTACGTAMVVREKMLDDLWAVPPCERCERVSPMAPVCGWCGARREVTRLAPSPGPLLAANSTLSAAVLRGGATAAMGSIAVTLADGDRGPTLPLPLEGVTTIGRTEGELAYPDDKHMSPRHCELDFTGREYVVRDLDSLNGVFMRLREPGVVPAGAVVVVGRQHLRVVSVALMRPVIDAEGTMLSGSDAPAVLWAVERLMPTGAVRDHIALPGPSVTFGRSEGDVRFPHDTFVSGKHVRMEPKEQGVRIVDLESSNGTWVRVLGTAQIGHGDQIMVGRVKFTLMLPHS